ncbi:MAG: carboxylating nicotinate-nucleotide diphosphorylase [Planctomycetota bacterium]
MPADFPTVAWDDATQADAAELIRLAKAEDLARGEDWTTVVTVDPDRRGAARFVARERGGVAWLAIGPRVVESFGADAEWEPLATDGAAVAPGQAIARIAGRAADLLTCERTILNFLGRLSGIATLTRQFVQRVDATGAQVYDTRKTTPGWRRLEKYAVACGGGRNHRLGLSEAVLIKDNHLALSDEQGLTPGAAVRRARRLLAERLGGRAREVPVEVEVDTLDQLRAVLSAEPDIVLLDNMTPNRLSQAVELRDAQAGAADLGQRAILEASGGVTLDTIGKIAASGVDRISVGALTHSASTLDIGLDWGE